MGVSPAAAPASQPWQASRRLSSSIGVRMSAGAAAAPEARTLAAPGSLALAAATSHGAAAGDAEPVQRLSGRLGLGGGLSRLSLSITDALRRLSIRSPPSPRSQVKYCTTSSWKLSSD